VAHAAGGREIYRADVADFMLKQLNGDRYFRKTRALAYCMNQ
jgi:hypothetical protein